MSQAHLSWWEEARFGMFIHWGLYALLAGEYEGRRTENIAEWIMHDLRIPREEYEKLAALFNPVTFDAKDIVHLAKEAGARYIVFTAKHHDGFAMFASSADSYNIVDATPFKRDTAQELRQACEEEGIKLCFYYSQAQDWHDLNGIEEKYRDPSPDFRCYLDHKCVPQLTELLTRYGKIGLIWFDTPMSMTLEESRELRDLVKSIQKDCLVSGRIGHSLGDYMTTGDNFIPLLPYGKPFEVPATINSTWGYNRFDRKWKSAKNLLRDMVRVVSRGGNYLLNIGPDAMGSVPDESVSVLQEIGTWMRANGESIYGTFPVPVYPYDIGWGHFTARRRRLYLHVFEGQTELYLINMGNKPLRASLLVDGRELALHQRVTCEGAHSWRIILPEDMPIQLDTVIRVDIAEDDVVFEHITD